jgi:hypothetical protein
MEQQPMPPGTAPGGPQIFDVLPKGTKFQSQEVRQRFDGTVFNGSNAVQVEFNDQGGVTQIRSVDLFSGGESAPFMRGRTGGWRGEGGFYGESTVMGKRLDAIIAETKNDWQLWKETEAQHPGVDFRTWKADRTEAMAAEHDRFQQEAGGGSNPKQTYSEAMQRHHDYYVNLEREGKLSEEDRANLELARQREKEGLVKPLTEGPKKE